MGCGVAAAWAHGLWWVAGNGGPAGEWGGGHRSFELVGLGVLAVVGQWAALCRQQ